MHFINKTTILAVALGLSGTAALAWGEGDAYQGHQDSSTGGMLIHAYPTKHNYCPAGLQPVVIGGVICCGSPNAGPYVDRAGGHKIKKVYKKKRHHSPRAYAPAGVKGVVYK